MSFEENSGILKFDVVTWSDIPQCWEIVSECCREDTSQLSPAESPLACQKIESETEKLIKMFYLSSEKRMSMILWNWVVYSDCEHFHDHLCSPLACPSEVHHLIYNESKKISGSKLCNIWKNYAFTVLQVLWICSELTIQILSPKSNLLIF